jgi:prepilin-type N-terminal cleavage/methylation domain-containing protein
MKILINNLQRGFTMIEMLVVMSIVVIMSVALFANYREIGDQGRVSSFAGKMREDLYLAQAYSQSSIKNKTNVPDGWGVYFNRNLSKYIIFSDLDGDKQYTYPIKLLIHGNEWSSGTTFTESSQSANTITVSNATQVNSPGMPPLAGNGYWQFDGVGDNLKVTNSSNFDFGSSDFSIDMWIYSDTTGSKKYLLSKGSGLDKVYELYKDVDNKIYFTIYNVSLVSTTLVSRSAISASSSTHIAVTKSNGKLKLFVGGRLQQSKRMTTAVRSLSADVYIGVDNDGTSSSWAGRIDEIRFSKGAGRWDELFSLPILTSVPDEEIFREVKLPPGLVFDYLNLGGVATTELNIFFDLMRDSNNNQPSYLMYSNNTSGSDAQIILNNAGVVGTGQPGDTPQTLTIGKSGTINWTH